MEKQADCSIIDVVTQLATFIPLSVRHTSVAVE